MRYAIVIERAGGNFSAYLPDLAGCVATASTQKEVETLLRAAIELHLAGMREDNQPIPQPSSRVEYLEVEVAAR
ncbi:MAG: type II toxin-antitoxin system HicB family antitoxin [Hyphomicrobium sp.]